MKLVPCPLHGPRPMEEFVYGGELRPAGDAAVADDAAWGRHVFDRQGIPATRREWWYHLPSGTWFVAVRNTASGEFLETTDAADHRS